MQAGKYEAHDAYSGPNPYDLEIAKNRAENLDDQKSVEFYSAAVNAWITTSMELDKSLLTLASGAIAFSMTMVTPLKSSDLMIFLYFLANISFISTVGATLTAFAVNKREIEKIVKDIPTSSRIQVYADRIAICSFVLGVICLFTIGAYNVFKSDTPKEKEVAENNQQKTAPVNKSLAELQGLQSCNESFDQLQALKPQSAQRPVASNAQPKQNPSSVQGTLSALKPCGPK